MESSLTIGIASDLHCTYPGEKTGPDMINTHLPSDLLKFPISRNPVESLRLLTQEQEYFQKKEFDLLLCPGDLTDKMNKQGLSSGWGYLQQIKQILQAKSLAVAIGNHDVDSRNTHGVGPFELVKNLHEQIPSHNKSANERFWKDHFCIVESDKYLLLIINSCYNHTSPDLSKATQIEERTIEQIRNELSSFAKTSKIKIALCHHHPILHSNMDYKDTDFLDKSDRLLALLEKNDFTLFVHGHKHDPRLQYFNNTLPVLAAGSFSSTSNLMRTGAQNTFHVITIDLSTRKGKIDTWIYFPKSGWLQKLDCYFPCKTGFGYTNDLQEFAKKCNEWFTRSGRQFVEYSEVQAAFPDIDHLIPAQQEKLNEIMMSKFNLSFTPHLPNRPERLYQIS